MLGIVSLPIKGAPVDPPERHVAGAVGAPRLTPAEEVRWQLEDSSRRGQKLDLDEIVESVERIG
jgi:hypothetical protein